LLPSPCQVVIALHSLYLPNYATTFSTVLVQIPRLRACHVDSGENCRTSKVLATCVLLLVLCGAEVNQRQSKVNKNRAAPLDQKPDNFLETAVICLRNVRGGKQCKTEACSSRDGTEMYGEKMFAKCLLNTTESDLERGVKHLRQIEPQLPQLLPGVTSSKLNHIKCDADCLCAWKLLNLRRNQPSLRDQQ
jgi:hypothetical protein